jgi:hypothetical protein
MRTELHSENVKRKDPFGRYGHRWRMFRVIVHLLLLIIIII